MTPFSRFPEDIYVEILARVPVRTSFVCKCVCRSWFHTISSPSFIKMHYEVTVQKKNPNLMFTSYDWRRNALEIITISYDSVMSYPLESSECYERYDIVRLDYPFISFRWTNDVELLGCCNGLIYFLDNTRRLYCLWNPATREYKIIPKLILGSALVELGGSTGWIDPPLTGLFNSNNTISLHAFGYDCKIGDYKVFCVEYLSGSKDGCLIHVYSLGTNSWTSSHKELDMVPVSIQNGVLVNGLLHWLGRKHGKKVIMSLDISNENFKELEQPKEALENSLLTVEVSEGLLCVLVEVVQVQVEVWVMRDYGVRKSWSKCYIHDDISNIRLSCTHVREDIINSSRKLMWSFGGILLWDGYRTVFHDLKYLTERRLSTRINFTNLVVNYFESLVSVNSGIYVGKNPEDKEEKTEGNSSM